MPVRGFLVKGCYDKYLNALSPHSKRHQLHQKGLASARGSENGNVRIFIDLRIENIHDRQRIVVTVDTQKNAVIVTHFKADKWVTACCSACQNVTLGALEQMLFKVYKRERGSVDL